MKSIMTVSWEEPAIWVDMGYGSPQERQLMREEGKSEKEEDPC